MPVPPWRPEPKPQNTTLAPTTKTSPAPFPGTGLFFLHKHGALIFQKTDFAPIPKEQQRFRNMSNRSLFLLLAASIAASQFVYVSPLQAEQTSIIECTFGSGRQSTELVLVVPDGPKKGPSRSLELRVAPGGADERAAIATKVKKQNSEIGKDYAQVIFQTDSKTGFVVRIAENGDGVTFPLDQSQGVVGSMYYGGCSDPGGLFDRWY
jgi:hypothetical protein